MKRIFFVVLFLFNIINLNACNLCSLDIPKVYIKTTITSLSDKTNFNITWEFDEKFLSSLLIYDENENNILDKNEQNDIKNVLEEYLKPLNYLTNITYLNKDEKPEIYVTQKILNPTTSLIFKEKTLLYNMDFSLNFKIEKDKKLFLSLYDEGNNFNFILKDVVVKNYLDKKVLQMESSEVNIYFYNYIQKLPNKKPLLVKAEAPDEKKVEESFISTLSLYLEDFKAKIEVLLKDIKENNSFISYVWLLIFSFTYGVLHAIGPGHGKSLVAAYFLSEEKSYLKGFYISFLIGLVHTFSAFILTLFIYYVLNILFASVFSNIEQVASKISAVIIISIALYLIYKKYKQHKIHKHHSHNSCACGGCSTNSTDIGIILSAGIVPCPGTITIFLFTFSLGIYFVGFLSAIFMSMGMSFIIFITAYLSTKVRQQATTNQTLIKIFEYASLFFILILGIVLFII